MNQPKVCEICGREYKRTKCEYCQRLLMWKEGKENELKQQLFSARIIRDLGNADLSRFKLGSDLTELKEVGGFFVTGKVGTGKTIYAAALTLEAAKRQFMERDRDGWKTYEFVTVVDLLNELKESYDKDSVIKESEIIKKYAECDWLVLDDFGTERVNEWAFQTLYLIINRRYEWLRTTIFTSNLSLDALAEKLGDDRIPSRINSMCKVKVFRKVLR